jgi:hypothetical protein
VKLDLDHDDIKSGFAVGKAARMADWAFRRELREGEVVINRLRALKWQRENPDKRRVNANRYAAKPDNAERSLKLARARRAARHRAEGQVFTCQLAHCGAQFCRVPGVRGMGLHPRFCTPGHYATWRKRQTADPAKQRPCSVCAEKGHNRRGCRRRA